MKFNSVVLLSSALFMSTASLAAGKPSAERWFEMEVILFSQLADKTLLKETFPDGQTRTKYSKVLDLLSPYLNPDIKSLKQQLSACDDNNNAQTLVKQAVERQQSVVFTPKTLVEIATSISFPETVIELNEFDSDNYLIQEQQLNNAALPNKTAKQTLNQQALDQKTLNQKESQPLDQQGFTQEEGLSEQQQALVILAEQAFSPIQFNYSVQDLPKQLCRVETSILNEYQQQHTDFAIDGFSLDEVPTQINAIEDIYSNRPYLLSKRSLKLRSIVTQLRRSKNFKPLLHIGWRQAAVSRRRAIPVRLFAGDNLQADFQKANVLYQQNAQQSKAQEQQLLAALSGTAEMANPQQNSLQSNLQKSEQDEQQLTQRLNLQIQDILAQVNTVNFTGEQDPSASNEISDIALINELNKPVVAFQDISEFNQHLMLASAPEPPVQPWFLDGFFKVHLNHYLYINADFNVMNMSLAEQATSALLPKRTSLNEQPADNLILQNKVQAKTINFKQNRRVISGEIHYFDHPYIGMIVQIRRFKRPRPPKAQSDTE